MKKITKINLFVLSFCLGTLVAADAMFGVKAAFHAKSSQWAVIVALNVAALVLVAFVALFQKSERLRLMKISPVFLSAGYYGLTLLLAVCYIAIEASIPQQLLGLFLAIATCGFFLFVFVVAFAFDYIASFAVIED